jgi:hypothetical protein
MPKKTPYNHRPELRARVREYLELVPKGRRATLEMITSGTCDLMRDDQVKPTEDEIKSVLGFLLDGAEISSYFERELERNTYALR